MSESQDPLSRFHTALAELQSAQAAYHQEALAVEGCLEQLGERLCEALADPPARHRRGEGLKPTLDSLPSSVLVWCKNGPGELLYANRAAAQSMGFPVPEGAAEDIGAALARLGTAGDGQLEVDRTGQAAIIQVERRDPPGGPCWIRVNSHAVKNDQGALVATIAFGMDITHLREADGLLHASGQNYQALFEAMTEGFLLCETITGPDGELLESRILDANPAFEEATGLSLSAICQLEPGTVLPGLAGCLQRAHAGRADGGAAEPECLTLAERGLCFEVRAFWPELNQVALVFSDVTERRKGEQRAALANEELETLVRERTLALETAIDELSREVDGRKRQERLQTARLKVLENMMGPGSVAQCLGVLLEQLAEIFPDHPASVLLLDPAAGCLRVGATLGLPASYDALMDGVPLGSEVSCSAAACLSGKRVIVENLETHPLWAKFRDVARSAHLAACWSEPILAATGEVLGVFGIYAKAPGSLGVQDLKLLLESARLAGLIIERKRGRELRFKLFSAVEASPHGTIITDLQGTIEYVNPRFAEITGYASAEALGKNPRILNSGLTPPAVFADLWATILDRRTWHGELLNRRKDGTLFWQKLSIAPVADAQGQAHHFIGITEDITGQRELQESRARLAAAVDQAAEAMAVLDSGTRILFANPAFYWMLGLVPEESLGREFPSLVEGFGGDGGLDQALEEALKGGFWHGRVAALGRSKGRIDLEGSISPVREPDGRIASLVAVFRDVTREADLDRQLREAQKLDALGALAGGIAHDFNNILSAILSAAELIEWQLEPNSPVRSKLEIIYKAGQRARDLNQQILTFSRRNEEKWIPFDFSALVREVAALLRTTLPENIAVRAEIASSVWVTGDPSQLHQVLMNLAINGYHAMKDQGGELSLGLAESEQEAAGLPDKASGAGRFAVLTVSDTGCGMSAETRKKIFEPFFTTKPQGEGSGLGLSVVHGIVAKHGGSIQVASEPGRGTRFQVAIPCQPRQPQASAATEGDAPGGSEHILFVDDEDMVAALTKEGLQALGYHVTAKTNEFDALEVFKANPDSFDLLVTDLAMPHFSGAELTKRLRKIRPDLPALLVTGAFQASDSNLRLTVSFAEILNKPLSIKDLAGAVRRVMDGRRAMTPRAGFIEAAMAEGRPVVLFAEDSKVTRTLIRTWLTKNGYRVLEAKDGQEAWEIFCAAQDSSIFSLVLTDLDMPRMGGLELVARVRGRDPELPVLVLTASEDMASLKQALQLHVDDFLNKPFDSKGLLAHVRRLVAERRSGADSRQSAETAQDVRLAQKTMEATPEPDLPVYSICEPLTDAGGDVFRCLQRPDGSVLLVLADVAGHSVLSSYAVASFLGMLATFAQDCRGLVGLFQRLNHGIQAGPFPETAIAVLAAHWDPATGRLHVVNAGNPYGIWLRKGPAVTEPIALKGTPLGLFDQARLTEKVLVLEPGDRVLFGTDGLFDTLSPDRVHFRELVPLLWRQAAAVPIQQALGAMCDAAKRHGDGRIGDDILVVGLEQPPWSPGPHRLLRAYPSLADSVDLADREVEALLAGHPQGRELSASRRFDLHLALHEALSNAIEHGNGRDPGKRVVLDLALAGDTAQVRVVDEGAGFDLAACDPAPTIDSERHRGIPILRGVTDGLRMLGGELEFHFDLKGAVHDRHS